MTPGSAVVAAELSLGLAEPTVVEDDSGAAHVPHPGRGRLDAVLAEAVDALPMPR